MGAGCFGSSLPLVKAAKANDAAAITQLLSNDTLDVNAKDSGGSALHHAARSGHVNAIEALLASPKVDVNRVHTDGDKNRITPLKAAMVEHQVAVVKLLLSDQRINLTATKDKPFRKKAPQEPEFKYNQARERAEYKEGVPLLVFAARLGSKTSYRNEAPEVAEILGVLLADERTTVDQTLGKQAMLCCLENDACLAHLKAHCSRTCVDDAKIAYARDHPEQTIGGFIVAAF